MSGDPRKNEWFSPGTVLGIIGMLGAIAGAYMSFDGRLARVEQTAAFLTGRLDRIEGKIDHLMEMDRK